ncbi:MAG: hypothetical protein ACKVU1_11495 [bacterium]
MRRSQISLSIFIAVLAAGALSPLCFALAEPESLLPPIVFVSRDPVRDTSGEVVTGAVPGIGPRDRTARPGGRLLLREAGGALRTLVDESRLFDVADPCVSWDATRILLAGVAHPDSSWRLYEIAPDGSAFRQVTFSNRDIALSPLGSAARRFHRYDDIDPCYFPDGRILFSSTRYPAISEYDDHLATNLFVMEADGTCLNRLTSERSGGEEPAFDPLTGRIVYTRWWVNRDRPSNTTRDGITTQDDQAITEDIANIWQTVSIFPDGHGIKLHAGDPRSRAGSVCYKPTPLADGRVLAVTAEIGAFSPEPRATGIRLFAPGADSGQAILGFQPGGFTKMPDGALVAHQAHHPRALDPAPLPDGRLVLAFASDGARDFGIVLFDPATRALTPLVDLPATHELDAAIVAPRTPPPEIFDQFVTESAPLPPTEDPSTFFLNDTFRFDCLNVFANAPVDAPIPDAPRIAANARIRFFLNFQRKNSLGRDPAILYREAPVAAFGGVHEHDIPAEVPMFEQLIDGDGHVITTPNGSAAHVTGMNFARQGEGTKCVGCHAGHSVIEVAKNGEVAEWFNAATSATVLASSEWIPAGAQIAPSPGARVVDRRARSDSLAVAWIAAGDNDESVELSWPIPIEVSQLVIYGVRPNASDGTDLRVENCRVELLSRGRLAAPTSKTGPIDPDGTAVSVPVTVIDGARVTITKARGQVRGERLTGLAEVEVIARIAAP